MSNDNEGTFHALMTYLTGVNGHETRKKVRKELDEAATANAVVHDYARQALSRGNSVLSELVEYMSEEHNDTNRTLPSAGS